MSCKCCNANPIYEDWPHALKTIYLLVCNKPSMFMSHGKCFIHSLVHTHTYRHLNSFKYCHMYTNTQSRNIYTRRSTYTHTPTYMHTLKRFQFSRTSATYSLTQSSGNLRNLRISVKKSPPYTPKHIAALSQIMQWRHCIKKHNIYLYHNFT